jgi:hypothetical protein
VDKIVLGAWKRVPDTIGQPVRHLLDSRGFDSVRGEPVDCPEGKEGLRRVKAG